MHAHSSYTIVFHTIDNATLNKYRKYLDICFWDSYGNSSWDKEIYSIEDTYNFVFLEEIRDLMIAISRFDPTVEIDIEGYIDTSESAGEYMDFNMHYENNVLTVNYSDWYLWLGYSYENYEEFCEEFGDKYTEEQFKGFMESDHYIVDYDNIVPKVELKNSYVVNIGDGYDVNKLNSITSSLCEIQAHCNIIKENKTNEEVVQGEVDVINATLWKICKALKDFGISLTDTAKSDIDNIFEKVKEQKSVLEIIELMENNND